MAVATVQRLTLAEVGTRAFKVVEPGVCYHLYVPGASVTFELDRLTWHKQELSGELLVRCDLLGTDGVDGVLSVATFNVSSARARSERASQLERQSRARDVPWQALIEELCQRVLAAERSGEPAVALRSIDRPDESERLVRVFGFQLPWRHPAIVFGDGGSAKSYLALYLGGLLAEEGYRVALFDWELDGADHRERFERLFASDMPDTLFYTRCARPLVYDADRLKRIVRTQHIDFAIYDSIGFACHDAPESAESALAYFRGVRQIGVGSLHVAHVSKAEGGDQKPFGSTFFHNSARATWNIKPTEDGTGNLTLGVFNRKPNLTARQQPFGIQVRFDADRTRFKLCDLAAVEEFAPQLTVLQRIRSLLRAGAMSRDAIAAALDDQKPDTLRRKLNQAIERGQLVRFPGPNGIEQIGLKVAGS